MQVHFKRDGDIREAAARLMGLPADGSRVVCLHLPHFERHGYSLHLYFDWNGIKAGREHNSDASQLYLIANLPQASGRQPERTFGALLTYACTILFGAACAMLEWLDRQGAGTALPVGWLGAGSASQLRDSPRHVMCVDAALRCALALSTLQGDSKLQKLKRCLAVSLHMAQITVALLVKRGNSYHSRPCTDRMQP